MWQETKAWQDGKTVGIETWQDVEDIIEANKVSQSANHKSDWGKPIAEIPNVIVTQWLNEEWKRGNRELRYLGPGWKQFVRKKLADPDWRWLRLDNPSNPFHLGWRK